MFESLPSNNRVKSLREIRLSSLILMSEGYERRSVFGCAKTLESVYHVQVDWVDWGHSVFDMALSNVYINLARYSCTLTYISSLRTAF